MRYPGLRGFKEGYTALLIRVRERDRPMAGTSKYDTREGAMLELLHRTERGLEEKYGEPPYDVDKRRHGGFEI